MRAWSEVTERVAGTTKTSEKTAILADYLASHGFLRLVLSQYAGLPPPAWRFVRSAYGKPEVVPPAGWVSDVFPFAHAIRLFGATLYDADPWRRIAIEVAWLGGLTLAFGSLARVAMRRLLA